MISGYASNILAEKGLAVRWPTFKLADDRTVRRHLARSMRVV
jgi:hypothetical protein